MDRIKSTLDKISATARLRKTFLSRRRTISPTAHSPIQEDLNLIAKYPEEAPTNQETAAELVSVKV